MLDGRVTATCNLGPLIRADIASADDLQQNGLIKYRGSCEISGKVTPSRGTVVTFQYVKGGNTYSIPKRMHVLNAFYNPFTKVTTVELGCILTLRGDMVKEEDYKVDIDRFRADNGISSTDFCRIGAGFLSSWTVGLALDGMGVTANGDAPTEAVYRQDEWDFSEGYAANVSRLLETEGYVGDTDENGVLNYINLNEPQSVGPSFSASDIISVDIASAGQEPAPTVSTEYNNFQPADVDADEGFGDRCQIPEASSGFPGDDPGAGDANNQENWTRSVAVNEKTSGPIAYPGGTYRKSFEEWVETITEYENGYPVRVVETRSTAASDAAGQWFGARLQSGILPTDVDVRFQSETLIYYNNDGERIREEKYDYVSPLTIASNINAPPAALAETTWASDPTVLRSKTVTIYLQAETVTRTITHQYELPINTIGGQQSTALSTASAITSGQALVDFVTETILNGVSLTGTSVSYQERSTTQERQTGFIERFNNDTTESTETLRSIVKFESTGIIEDGGPALLSSQYELPLKPTYNYEGTSGSYTKVDSLAELLAQKYGITQNRIRLGNKYAISIQVPAERMPGLAFTALYVNLEGLVVQYRTNQISWVIEPGEVVAGCNAIYWGTAGTTAVGGFAAEDTFVPLAPSVTTITEPAPAETVSPTYPSWGAVMDPASSLPGGGSSGGGSVAPGDPVPVEPGYSYQIDYRLTALQRSFALRGKAAATHLTVNYELSANKKAFTLAGSESTLTKSTSYTLSAENSAVAINGEPAVFLLGAGLTAGTGGYSLTGRDAALNVPEVVGTFIDSNQTTLNYTMNVPTHSEGDTLIAFVAWTFFTGNSLTPPSGWTLYNTYLLTGWASFTQGPISVYTKTATASEPANYTWTCTSGAYGQLGAMMMVSVSGAVSLSNATTADGNGATSTIATTSSSVLNITMGRWLYTGASETYSQSIDTGSVTNISDSPTNNAYISAGYTYSTGTVTSTHSTATTTGSPNHRMIKVEVS